MKGSWLELGPDNLEMLMARLLKQVEGLAGREGVSFYLVSPLPSAFPLCLLFTQSVFILWVLFGVLMDTGRKCPFPSGFFHDYKCFLWRWVLLSLYIFPLGAVWLVAVVCPWVYLCKPLQKREKEMSAVVGYWLPVTDLGWLAWTHLCLWLKASSRFLFLCWLRFKGLYVELMMFPHREISCRRKWTF